MGVAVSSMQEIRTRPHVEQTLCCGADGIRSLTDFVHITLHWTALPHWLGSDGYQRRRTTLMHGHMLEARVRGHCSNFQACIVPAPESTGGREGDRETHELRHTHLAPGSVFAKHSTWRILLALSMPGAPDGYVLLTTLHVLRTLAFRTHWRCHLQHRRPPALPRRNATVGNF